jgi:hypothetical protein
MNLKAMIRLLDIRSETDRHKEQICTERFAKNEIQL